MNGLLKASYLNQEGKEHIMQFEWKIGGLPIIKRILIKRKLLLPLMH